MTRGCVRINLGMNELTQIVQALIEARPEEERPILRVAKAWGIPSQRLYDLFRRGTAGSDTLRAISRATGCPYRTLLLAAHPEEDKLVTA